MKVLKHLLAWLVSAALVLAALEVVLRTEPSLIPLTLLKRYPTDLRLEIAQQRGLWNASQMWELERDDGGPRLTLFKPNSQFAYEFGKNEKGVIRMDDQGFCNPPRDPYDRPEIDIFAIGDSFTWCIISKPEINWISQIGEITGLSVYNLGRGGVGPYEYLQILKRFGLTKDPDYVIMNIYEGNDLRDSDRYHRQVEAAKEGRVLFGKASDRNELEFDYDRLLDHPILRNSYAIDFVVAAFGKAYDGARYAYRRATGDEAEARVDFRYRLHFTEEVVAFNTQNADESEVRYARMLKATDVDLSLFDEALKRFVELAKKYDFTPIVAYSPSAYTAYTDFVEFEDPSLSDLMPWFSQMQRQYLDRKATEFGYIFVDLTPALQSAGRSFGAKQLLYFPINVHYTETGNRIVGYTLAEVIKDLEMKKLTEQEP